MVAHFSVSMLIFLMAAGFVASFVDSVVGGGGLITVPALMLSGLPPQIVLGTNKLASSMGTVTSMISFFRSGKVDFQYVRWLFPLSLLGSAIGVFVVRVLPTTFLKPIVIVLLIAVTIYTLVKKNWGDKSTFQGVTKKTILLGALTALLLGFYDGFFGPGTGSFLIFIFLMLGFDFVSSAGNAKVLNFGSNLAAMITFMLLGMTNFLYGIPMGIAMIAGALVGSRVAIRKGVSYVRPLFLSVSVLMIGKQIWDLLGL